MKLKTRKWGLGREKPAVGASSYTMMNDDNNNNSNTTTTTPNAIEITDSVEGLLRLLSIEEKLSYVDIYLFFMHHQIHILTLFVH